MSEEGKQQQQPHEEINVDQIKAENASYKALIDQQRSTIEKHEGLISKLRKVESRAERSESILKEALGAVAMGVPEHYQKLVEPLPIEQRWELLKAYPRQMAQAADQGKQPEKPPADQQQPAAASQPTQAPQQQPAQVPGRPATPQIESAYDRAKRDLQASGAMNMHNLLEAFMRTKT